jgi:hypothetical protein
MTETGIVIFVIIVVAIILEFVMGTNLDPEDWD